MMISLMFLCPLLPAFLTLLFPSVSLALSHKDVARNRRQVFGDISAKVLVISTLPPSSVHALTPEEASKAYDNYASTYDELDGGKASDILGIDEARANLFGQARGAVLEIGCGTGLNLAKYDLSKVTSLTLLDVSEGMLQEARNRASSLRLPEDLSLRFIQGDATSELVQTFGKESFDTVVDSFSFCVMGTQGVKECLEQMSQVVKPKAKGGQILLLENTRSSNLLLGLYQDATADAAASIGGKGCVYNQNVSKMIESIRGLQIVREDLYAAGIFRSYMCQVDVATIV